MKRSRETGFSIVGALIVVVIIALVGLMGWKIYDSQSADEPKVTEVQYSNVTDTSESFSFAYPDTWVMKPYEPWEPCCGDVPEPDWTKEPRPITLHPKDNEQAVVKIVADKYGDFWASFEDVRSRVKEDYFAKVLFEGKKEHGRDALFSRVDYLGPPDAKVESFTDHRYYFDLGTSLLRVDFREKYHHDWHPDRELDDSRYTADFERIAGSIKLLK